MSYRLVWRSIRGLWDTSRHTVYLPASALFRDGLAGVFAFGAVLAAGTFGLSAGDVIVFGAAANIVAGFATMAFGMLDDRIGPKRVILISLGSLVVLGVLIFVLHDGGAQVFWVLGLLMTLFVGPAQAASRSFLARLIPEGRNGEIFASTRRPAAWCPSCPRWPSGRSSRSAPRSPARRTPSTGASWASCSSSPPGSP